MKYTVMESISSHSKVLAISIIQKMIEACETVLDWNKSTTSADDYMESSEGMQRLAASCMLIESIGEGVKKIDKLIPNLLTTNSPEVPWKEIKGLRDHIAHGYFNIDEEIIFDIVHNELANIMDAFVKIVTILNC